MRFPRCPCEYRNLLHILSFATGMYLNADRPWPMFLPSIKDPPGEKTLGEHPDVRYRWAGIEGGRRHRITGRRGDEAYLSFTVHRGERGSGRNQFFDGHLNDHDLVTDADGRFEVIVSPEREGTNWLRASTDANEIYARAYHLDIDRDRPAVYEIEPIGTIDPIRWNRAEITQRLREMTRLVREMTLAFPQPLTDANTMGELWHIDTSSPSRMWTAVDNTYSRGVFRLEPGQALLLEGEVVPCDYWGIQIWSPFLSSGDHRRHRVTINSRQARRGPNGEFSVALAANDPQLPGIDFVSTAGNRQGTFFIRWMCPQREPAPPTCTLIDLD